MLKSTNLCSLAMFVIDTILYSRLELLHGPRPCRFVHFFLNSLCLHTNLRFIKAGPYCFIVSMPTSNRQVSVQGLVLSNRLFDSIRSNASLYRSCHSGCLRLLVFHHHLSASSASHNMRLCSWVFMYISNKKGHNMMFSVG